MASSVIHMVIAKKINDKINYDIDKILIGSVAPDISKEIGKDKFESHFLDTTENDIPNIDKFLKKYKKNLNDSFVMGYFIHLYTDYLWFKYFLPEVYFKPMIKKIDGSIVKCSGNMLDKYIYNDYTNLNIKLLEEYDLDLKSFYYNIPYIEKIIEEIPIEKINIIIDKVHYIIENTKVHKDLIFDINAINKFIDTSVELIIAKICECI